MKVYKVEVMIIDHEDIGEEAVKSELENANFANDCIRPRVVKLEARDIGEWEDSNPLNFNSKWREEYERLFSTPGP